MGGSNLRDSNSRLILVWLCGALAFPRPASSQIDSALGYFPLHTGDIHQFLYGYSQCPGSSHHSYHTETVMGDSLMPNGRMYTVVLSDMPQEDPVQFLRIDSMSGNVYRYVYFPVEGDQLMDSLRASVNSSFIREGWENTVCTGVSTDTLFGVPRLQKEFEVQIIFSQNYTLTYGLGRTEYITKYDDYCYPGLTYYVRRLVYVKIGDEAFGTRVGVDESSSEVPSGFSLARNYPNPFNPETSIEYTVGVGSGQLSVASVVRLAVYDVLGREVALLVNEAQAPGTYTVRFDGSRLSSGVYVYRLQSDGNVLSRTMMLLK